MNGEPRKMNGVMTEPETSSSLNPSSDGSPGFGAQKPKVVVIMGPTGSGKSRLAIDLASYFPIEIINADSMQVYRRLDVLTNKVPSDQRKGETNPMWIVGSGFLYFFSEHVSVLC